MCARGGNLHGMGNNRTDSRKKGRRGLVAIIITLSVLVLLAGAAAAVYFLAFDTVTIVSDSSFTQIIPSGTFASLRLRLAMEAKRLRIVNLPDQCFRSTDVFIAKLAYTGGSCIILTPVPAAYAVINNIDLSALIPDAVVIGIHDVTGTACFDVTLVSDELSGWQDAASAILAENSSMARNVALIYENQVDELAQGIVDSFPAGHVTEFRKEGSARMFSITTYDTMDAQGIVLALCPYVTGFSGFFNTDHAVSWIVDYRFAYTVPDANLYGVVSPDLGLLPSVIRAAEKGARSEVALPYVYEKR